jgi:hypothetical protein
MAVVIYSLCLITALCCAAILVRAFTRTRRPLLMWASLCFLCLALNEAVVMVDLYLLPDLSFRILRSSLGLTAALLMLVGLIFPARGSSR